MGLNKAVFEGLAFLNGLKNKKVCCIVVYNPEEGKQTNNEFHVSQCQGIPE